MQGLKLKTVRSALLACAAVAIFATGVGLMRAQLRGETDLPVAENPDNIEISADYARHWEQDGERVMLLRGHCRVAQGDTTLESEKMVVWQHTTTSGRITRHTVDVFLEDNVRLQQIGQTTSGSNMYISLATVSDVTVEALRPVDGEPATEDSLYQRGEDRRKIARRHPFVETQLTVPPPGEEEGPAFQAIPMQPIGGSVRRLRIFPRSGDTFQAQSYRDEATLPPEQVTVITGGVNVVIEPGEVQGIGNPGTVDLAADRIVIWTQSLDLSGGVAEQSEDQPLTIYLEGNIVIRQADRQLRASQAVYDAREDRALLLNAELRTFVPALNGDVRVRAQQIRQISESQFHATNAWASGSPYGKPGYRVQAQDVFIEQRLGSAFGEPGAGMIDPETGEPISTYWITSLNNTFYIEDVPVLYSPYLSAPAEDPQIPLRRISAGQDRVFGARLQTAWDLYALLGMSRPEGVDWNLLADVFSERGPAIGTEVFYEGADDFLGLSGPYVGEGLLYYIHDSGEDNLGTQRRSIDPDTNNRGRIRWLHRQELDEDLTVWAELGILSDRNFLEQYYEKEFDQEKDNENLLFLKKEWDVWAGTVMGRAQLNDFEQTTEWAPRGNLYGIGQQLFGGAVNWYTQSEAGYGFLRPFETPDDPEDAANFVKLPWVTSAEGAVLMTRHQFDAPFNLGPVLMVPFVQGEAAHFSEGFDENEVDRLFGRAGLRSSLMFTKIFPYAQSRLLNVNGLAHKMIYELEYSAQDSSADLDEIPQYHEFDDDAQERFRSFFIADEFGGVLPDQFDPRFYAVRSGAGNFVSVPYWELVDDQQALRFALRQRLQTKVGPPDRLRIKDWMTFDVEATLFPNEDRDNFGEDIGLFNTDYNWYISERTSIQARSRHDFFDEGQDVWSISLITQRSLRGSFFLGLRQVDAGPIDSRIVGASYAYRMSPKWISTFGTGYDLQESRNTGQSITITRIGLDFLCHLGANYDAGKDNAGFAFMIEPRFGNASSYSPQLSSLLSGSN